MRKSLLFIIMIGLFGAYACKKNKGPADVDSIKSDNSIDSALIMTALINGVAWKTDSAYSYKVRSSSNDSESYNLMISATQIKDNAASTITFNITDFRGVGVYKINPPINTATYYNGNLRHFSNTGTFTVTADTAMLLSGTFSFVADTVSVLDGEFKVIAVQ